MTETLEQVAGQAEAAPVNPPALPVPDSDLGATYAAGRAQVLGEGPIARMLRQGVRRVPVNPNLAAPSSPEPAGGGEPAESTVPPPPEPPRATPQRNWLDAIFDLLPKDPMAAIAQAGLTQMTGKSEGQRAVEMAKDAADLGVAVGKDVGEGIMETPGAVARGVAEGLNNTSGAVGELADWLYQHMPEMLKGGPLDGVEAIRQATGNPDFKPSDARITMPVPFDERQAHTGKMVEFTAQWLTGRKLAGGVAEALGVPANVWTEIVKDMASGAVAFDPHHSRLSNLVNDVAPNPLTEWLMAKPDDTAAEGRLKNALEIGGLGAGTEGIIRGLRVLKANALADERAATQATGEPVPVGGGTPAAVDAAAPQARDWLALGDRTAPLVQVSDDIAEKAGRFLRGEAVDSPVKFNLARIEGPEDVQNAIGELSRLLPEQGPVTLRETEAAARELGMTPEQLVAMQQGGALNAKEITAARMLMRSSAEQLQQLATKATGIGATDADVAAFNRAFALTYGIAQKVKGSTTEIARALSAHRIVAQSEPDAVKAIRKLLDESGGPAAARDMAEKIAALDDPQKVAELVGEAAKGSTKDKISYVYMNMLVSNPPSHMANVMGNASAATIGVWERWLAGKIGSTLGGDGVQEGEAMAQTFGMFQGLKDGIRAFGRALKTGQQSFGGAKEMSNPSALGTAPLDTAGPLQSAADYLKMMLPARWLGAEDELFKWVNYRGELNSLAFRQARGEGLAGEEMAARINELTSHPPDAMHEAAVVAAREATFNAPMSQRMTHFTRFVNDITLELRPGVEFPVGRVLLPFISTPTNIAKWSFERSGPLALISREVRADVAAGGARRDMALAKMTTGTLLAGTAMDLALSGTITGGGPRDPQMRAALVNTGWQPYSVRAGDKYYSYARFDTPGQLMGAVADTIDIMAWAKEEDRDNLAAAIGLAMAKSVTSKTYMGNVAKLLDAVSYPERYGEKFVQSLEGSTVPAIVANAERIMDPTVRAVHDLGDAIRARTPGLAEDLPPKRDLWGRPVKVEGAWLFGLDPRYGQAISPVAVSSAKDSPVDEELLRLRLKIAPVKKHTSFDGIDVPLEPRELDRYAALQGQGVTDRGTGMNLYDTLNGLVKGGHPLTSVYGSLSDDGKATMIRENVQAFRAMARQKLLMEFPDLADAIAGTRAEKAQAARPTRR